MNDKIEELGRKADVIRELVADKAITVIEKYRNRGYHGREVSGILANLFEAVNDTVEQKVVDEVMREKATKEASENDLAHRTWPSQIVSPGKITITWIPIREDTCGQD